jgi:hypothetical protein
VTENLGFTAIDVALWEKKMRKKKKKTREAPKVAKPQHIL